MPHYKFDQIAFNITDKKMPEPGDEKMYIGLEHLDSGSLKITRWGSEVELTGQKLVMRKGDVLFGRRNTYLRRAAIAPHDGIFSAHGMIFRPKTQVIDPEYFPFFISSNYFMDAAIRISVGSLSPTVNWKTLKELEFDLPSLEEQRKNAALLKSINETKEAYQELLIQTDNLVKSQFIEMFGQLPEQFRHQTVELGSIADMLSGGTPSSKHPEYYGDKYPFVTTPCLGKNYINEDDAVNWLSETGVNKSATHIIPAYSVMYGSRVGVGKSSINTCEMCTNQDILSFFNIDTSKYDLLFIKKVMDQYFEYIDTQKRGTTIKGVPSDIVKAIRIPVVPIDEQREFAKFTEQSDKSKFELKEAIKSCDALMKAILFTNLEEKEG